MVTSTAGFVPSSHFDLVCVAGKVVCRQAEGVMLCEPVCYVTGTAVCTIAVPSAWVYVPVYVVCPVIHGSTVSDPSLFFVSCCFVLNCCPRALRLQLFRHDQCRPQPGLGPGFFR